MIKNYVFDFGNVLAKFCPDEIASAYVDSAEDRKKIIEVFFDRLYWDRLDDGTITDEEVKSAAKERLPEDLYKVGCIVYDSWIELRTPIPGMQKLVSDIKESGAKVFLISNISIGFAEGYHRSAWIKELFDKFDGLVFSGPIGIVKPGKEIYNYLLTKYNLKAEECIMIDDSPKNIEGAKNAGYEGYVFDGDAEKLRKTLGF